MRIQIKGDTVKLYGPIWDGDGAYISNQLESLEGTDPIWIRLHTPGGSVIDGNLIGSTIQALNRKVYMIVDGLAASMGAVLLTYADKVLIRKNAFIMIHEPSGGGYGTAKDLRSVADVLESMRANFIEVFTARTGKDKKDIEEWLNGDNWFDAVKAQSEKLVDGIEDSVIPDKDLKALKNMKLTAMLSNPDNEHKSFLFQNNSNSNKSKKVEMNKAELIQALGLKGVTAESSDTAIINAIKEQQAEAKEKAEKAEQEIQAIKQKQADEKKKQVIAIVDNAVKEGKITAEQKETFVAIGESNGVEALNVTFGAMAKHNPLSQSITGTTTGSSIAGKENWDWNKWQKEDAKGLEALKESNFEAFNNLFKAKFGKDFKA